MISIDALRADHLSCYGYDRETSPFIDRLAARGTRFSHAFVNTHGTPPSHTTMLSSLYQETHRVGFGGGTPQGRNDTIPQQVELVQQILRRHGWHTIGVTGGGYMSANFGFSRGFDSFSDTARTVAEGTSILLDRITQASDDDRPIFALFHTYEVHTDYSPPTEYREMFGHFESDVPPLGERLVKIQNTAAKTLKQADFDFLESQYDGEIRYTDSTLENLFSQLADLGFLENTVVILTADHGEEFGDHGGLLHRISLHEELLHIPLIVVGPSVEAGSVDPRLVSLIDVTPTILDAAGLPATPIMAGRSLFAPFDTASWKDQRVFAQYTHHLYCVRTPRWKLIVRPEPRRVQLFDLRHDPTETRNLARRMPDLVGSLAAEIDAWRAGLPHLDLGEGTTQELTERQIEDLRALGYVVD